MLGRGQEVEISFPGSPTCLAELRRAIRHSLAEMPAAIPDEVVDDLVLAVSEAATNAILYGSDDAQPVTVTVRVRGGWIEVTIRDRGRPAHGSRGEPSRAWAVADRPAGRRGTPCQGPPRDAGNPSPPHRRPRRRRVAQWAPEKRAQDAALFGWRLIESARRTPREFLELRLDRAFPRRA